MRYGGTLRLRPRIFPGILYPAGPVDHAEFIRILLAVLPGWGHLIPEMRSGSVFVGHQTLPCARAT